MPRFYLHVCNGTGFTEDQDGLEFPGLEEAREAAIRGLREILAGELKEGQLNQASFVEIVNDAGELQSIVSFEDAVNVTTERPDRA
jgi:predicted homoserine dehydrogenase-like protein